VFSTFSIPWFQLCVLVSISMYVHSNSSPCYEEKKNNFLRKKNNGLRWVGPLACHGMGRVVVSKPSCVNGLTLLGLFLTGQKQTKPK